MKKLLAVLLAALMLFAVVGCSSEPAANDGGDDQNVEGAQTGEELTKDNIKIGFIYIATPATAATATPTFRAPRR